MRSNPTDKISYSNWRQALALNRKAYLEIVESVAGFREEFDDIVKYYFENRDGDDFNATNQILIDKTNMKFDDLYSRYIANADVRNLLKQLNAKKYY